MSNEDSKIEDPTMDDDEDEYNDDDDEGFMEQVNVFLNAREGSPSNEKALEGILKKSPSVKTVKFAMDDAIFDPRLDVSKSNQELLSKISKLTEMLREAEEQSALERDKRKKKEKSLMKLAKELKKRNAQQETDKGKIEELEEKKQYLEHHWILAGKELDQEKVLRQKLEKEQEKDHEQALQHEKEKCIKLRNDYEKQIENMKKVHSKQCEELGREILKTNLEADRLHNQLLGSPRQTRLFSKRTSMSDLPIRSILASLCFALLVFTGHKSNLFTKEAVCAPVMPGLVLSRANAGQSFQAPWWVPPSHKAIVFEKLCGDSTQYPLALQWLPDGQDQRLLLNQGQKTVLKKNALVKVEVYGDRVRTWNKKGLAEDHYSLWSL